MTGKKADCRRQPGEQPCPCVKEADQEALAKVTKELGKVPPPLQVLAKRPGAVSAFSAYRDQVFEDGPLSERERALVQLTTAVALRLSCCIEKLVKGAKKAGLSQEEIVQATLIASIQSSSSILHVANEGLSAK